MALFLAEHWVWDFWFVQDGDHTHLFYLSAPRSLDDPNLRHWNVRIGHARSVDLRNWEILPDALWPAATPSWDDYTTWTGCVVRAEAGHWMMFYTGTSKAEGGCVQRIGVACSDDLIVWRRPTETPLLQADLRYYESLDLNIWYEQAFRDPWVFPDPKGDGWHMFFTAREPQGERNARGVIGHARSPDLRHWEQGPPIFRSKRYGHMEVPQPMEYQGRWYCVFCVAHTHIDPVHAERHMKGKQGGIHYLMAEHPLGPWHLPEEDFLQGDAHCSLYAGKLLVDGRGSLCLMAFRNHDETGSFIGEITDPMPLTVLDDGRLRLSHGREDLERPVRHN